MLKRPSLTLAALALTVSSLFAPAVAAAAGGNGPDTAPTLSGTQTGVLANAQSTWYQVAGDGSTPIGVTLDYVAADGSHPAGVFFNVDWTTADGNRNADWPGLFRYGQSSTYGLPVGTQYWTRSTSANTTYDVEVVNNSGLPITYAVASTGASFPPPSLSFAPSSPAPSAPSPAPAPATTPAPTPVATPAPTTNTATDRSGLTLDPTVDVSGEFSTINIHIDSKSQSGAVVNRLMIRPPDGAVVDAVVPAQTRPEDGIVWYLSQTVNQNSPLSSYYIRIYGPANGTVVEADWSTSNDKDALQVTISGAPNPAPPGQ
jgi:hypothetical protein